MAARCPGPATAAPVRTHSGGTSYEYPDKSFVQQRVGRIAGRQFDHRLGPANVEPTVERVQAAFGLRMIRSGMKIEHLAVFRQGLKAVGKALRYQQSSVVDGAENLRVPL